MPKIFAKKIGLIRTSAIGDTVHALAFINGLRKGFPEAQLTWILQNLPYEMVKHQKNIDRSLDMAGPDPTAPVRTFRSAADAPGQYKGWPDIIVYPG